MTGSKSTSTSATGSGQAWAQPYATAAAGNIASVWGANQPGAQAITGGLSGLLGTIQSNFGTSNPNIAAAQGYNRDVLAGKYLSGNPYLAQQIAATNRDVTNSVDSQFEQSGRYGSGAYAGTLGTSLANADNALRYQDYAQQMNNMNTAAGMAPTLAQASFTGIPEYLQTASNALQAPYVGTSAMAQGLGNVFNGGTSTSTQTTSPLGSIFGGIGSLMSGAGTLGWKPFG